MSCYQNQFEKFEAGIKNATTEQTTRYAALHNPGDINKATQIIDNISGVYKTYHVYHPTDGGKTKKLENILQIVKVATNSIYFRLSIDYGDTECHMHGIASYTDKNDFIYHKNDNDVNCLLKIIPSAKGITIKDVEEDQTCQAYCDPIEKVPNEFFAADQRKPIRYMARLKDSEEYKTTVSGKKDKE